jgi:hypothetical protein
MDKMWYTLPDKMENFTGHRHDTAGDRNHIRKNFPRWQWTGIVEFGIILEWCDQHLGNNFVWDWETIYFKTEQDKAFFLLRWQ